MLYTVNNLSSPNEKIVRLNRVFEEITTLDQQQRAEAIQNPLRPYKYFLDQSGYLDLMIDSLIALPWDTAQRKRLESLTGVLHKRNESFVAYMKVKAELANNKEFSTQLDTLASLLRESQQKQDSTIFAIEEKTVTTIVPDTVKDNAENERGFLKKLFGKKRKSDSNEALQAQTKVKIDTISIASQHLDYDQFHRVMTDLERDQRSQRTRLQNRELELIHTNSLFINRLLKTLHEVQNEELEKMNASNDLAGRTVDKGIERINMIMIGFVAGAALLIYLILIDISRSNYYKTQLEKAKNDAVELSEIKQRFLSNMSHEIRTPLQSIIGFTEQLREENPQNDAVEAIHSSSEHLLHIVNEVLDYSRISSGSFTLDKEPFNLLNILKEIESSMRIQCRHKKLKFVLNATALTNQVVVGDPFRLRQILYNLLGNAVKFTPSGSVTLAVDASENESKLACIFTVSDTGIGMTPEELKKVFNHFEQANAHIAKTYGGTGLGLTIAKSLIDVQHGTIDVASEAGKGTTFTIRLDFDKQALNGVPKPTSVQSRATPTATKVLVIDDDAMILRLCTLILQKHKIDFVSFDDPLKAADFRDDRVSHLFIDMRMPSMTGLELCGLLRKLYPNATFTALTAHVLPEERSSLLQSGFDAVLPKPFHEHEFLSAMGFTKSASDHIKHDFNEVRKMTMGDEALFNSIVQQFIDECDDDLGLLRTARNNRDCKEARELIHKLAGRIGQMGLHQLSTQWHDLEVLLVAGKEIHDILKPLNEAMRETDSLLNDIKESAQA